jgi:hypothetical protein
MSILVFLVSSTFAQDLIPGSMGLGVSLGSPSGLTGKMKLGEGQAIQFSIGGSTGQIGRVSVSTDFVQHAASITEPEDGYVITPYFGLGASINAETFGITRVFAGPRFLSGISVFPTDVPMDFFIEIAPAIYFYEQFSFGLEGGLGVRYYF